MSSGVLTVSVLPANNPGEFPDRPVVLRSRPGNQSATPPADAVVDTLDDLFDPTSPQYATWRKRLIDRLRAAAKHDSVTYVTPTTPLESDLTVQYLRRLHHSGNIVLGLARSTPPAPLLGHILENEAPVNYVDALTLFDAALESPFAGGSVPVHPAQTTVISNVSGEAAIGVVGSVLGRRVPFDVEISVLPMSGERSVEKFTLCDLAGLDKHEPWYMIVPPAEQDQFYRTADDLQRLVARLRAPEGCPWDREQNHQSLMRNMIEETYELIEAIHANDQEKIREELGDFVLQAWLHAQIAEEQGTFTLEDVLANLIEKLVRRHPHVFATVEAEDSDAVVRNWEEIKRDERATSGTSERETPLGDIPLSIPAIMRAQTLIRRAFRQGHSPEIAAFHRERALSRTGESDFERDTLAQVLGYVAAATARNVDLEALLRTWSRQFEQSFAEDRPAKNPN